MLLLRTLSVLCTAVAVVGLPAWAAVATETPPPDVHRVEARSVQGCDVTFEGVHHGAGVLTYDHVFTDTHVLDPTTHQWQLVPDTTPTVADLTFTPWTTGQQVAAGCAEPPEAPGAVSQQVRSEELNCGRGVVVSTLTTTVVGFTYDTATSTWVRGEPVDTVEVTESRAPEGACGDAVGPAQPAAATDGGVLVPIAVDAGA